MALSTTMYQHPRLRCRTASPSSPRSSISRHPESPVALTAIIWTRSCSCRLSAWSRRRRRACAQPPGGDPPQPADTALADGSAIRVMLDVPVVRASWSRSANSSRSEVCGSAVLAVGACRGGRTPSGPQGPAGALQDQGRRKSRALSLLDHQGTGPRGAVESPGAGSLVKHHACADGAHDGHQDPPGRCVSSALPGAPGDDQRKTSSPFSTSSTTTRTPTTTGGR